GAAQDALRHHSADTVALLEKSLAAEQDSEIRAAMQRSLAASQLFAGSKEERLAATRTLGSATDPQVKNLLDEFRYTANIDPDLYKAAGDALTSIDSRLRWTGIAANLFQGISLGSVLLLAAIGLAITFGVMGVINMAHGEMIMTGAYVAFVVQQLFRAFLPPDLLDAYLLVAVPVAFLFAGLLGVLLERCLSRFGLHMRAVTQNRDMAAAMGIPTARVDALTFGLGSGIAGMAGVALSQIGNVSPNLGTLYIVDSFMVVVFGGVGNLMGTLVGALSLGIVNKLLEPYAGAILGKIAVLVAIILFIQRRPRGLFALKGRAADAEA